MSKLERASSVSLAVNLVVGIYYFSAVFALAESGDFYDPAMAALITKLVIIAITLAILGEIVLHILSGRPVDRVAADERDKQINAKAMRNGYYVVTVGMMALMSHVVVVGGLDRFPLNYPESKPVMDFIGTLLHPLAPIVIAQFLLLASIAGSTVIYASRIFYYRRGY